MSTFRKRKFSVGEDEQSFPDSKKFASRHTFKASSESIFYMKLITQLHTKIGLLENEIKDLKSKVDVKLDSNIRIENKLDALDHKMTYIMEHIGRTSSQKADTEDIVDTIIEQIKSIDIFERKDKKEPIRNHQMSYIN